MWSSLSHRRPIIISRDDDGHRRTIYYYDDRRRCRTVTLFLLFVSLAMVACYFPLMESTKYIISDDYQDLLEVPTTSLQMMIVVENNTNTGENDKSANKNKIHNNNNDTSNQRIDRSQQQQQSYLRRNLLDNKLSISDVWEGLLEEGAYLLKNHVSNNSSSSYIAVMEVGVHRPIQCIQAAKAGLEAYCVEPSPESFKRVQEGVKRQPMDIQERIHLYNVAAGNNTSQGSTVPFKAQGGTGDHVGAFNMWKMQGHMNKEEADTIEEDAKFIQVPSMRMDDIIEKDVVGKDDNNESVFLLKIDTQGYEPTVFSGLTKSLEQQRIQYILFEYWPRGMDLLAGTTSSSCIGAKLLQDLSENNRGYKLYALGVEAHPKAPQGWQSVVDQRPLNDFDANCKWYYQVEQQFPSKEYFMGYWSDILAVAPNAQLPPIPRTAVGRALKEED